MLKGKRFAGWAGSFLIIFLVLGWMVNTSQANTETTYKKIDRGLFYLKEVFQTVSRNYVDQLDPETLSKSAIKGMLEEFDPYTVFFEDPGSHQMRMITRGKYGGVGMEIDVQDGEIVVISPILGTPAMRAGIHAGDIVLKIDSASTKTMSTDEASRRLRGKIGSVVKVHIKRHGVDPILEFNLIREEIVLKDITYSTFIEPGTAYIKLSGFSDKAGRELREAIRSLRAKDKIESVILDLRGNPGGLLTAAVEVANVFLPPGQLVVSTRGSHENENKFFTKDTPMLPNVPLTVLVDESSASASEIVAGAIQDLDRGVLIGNETFGKGLVQKVYPIDRVTQAYLKITTAKYYIPSGRSIQKEDYKHNNKVFTDLSDSLEYNRAIKFRTQNGRTVYGGGGIKPDIAVADTRHDTYVKNLFARGYFFRFVVEHLEEHPQLKDANRIVIDKSIMNKFQAFVKAESFAYKIEGERELHSFLRIAKSMNYSDDLKDLVIVATQKLENEKARQFDAHSTIIKQYLAAEFAEQIQGTTAWISAMLNYDEQVKHATRVLHNMNQYQAILAINN